MFEVGAEFHRRAFNWRSGAQASRYVLACLRVLQRSIESRVDRP